MEFSRGEVPDFEPEHHRLFECDVSASPDVDQVRGFGKRSNEYAVCYMLRPAERSVRRLHGGSIRGGRDQDVRGGCNGRVRDRSQATTCVKSTTVPRDDHLSRLGRYDVEGSRFFISAQAPKAQARERCVLFS